MTSSTTTLAGVHTCEGGCGRQLLAGQGRSVNIAGREARSCYSPPCVARVDARLDRESAS